MEDGVFPIASVSPVQSRQKLVRNFSHCYFDGCLLTCMKSVGFILEDKYLLGANATIQCHSWQSRQRSQDWSSTVTLQEVAHPGWVEACWQWEGKDWLCCSCALAVWENIQFLLLWLSDILKLPHSLLAQFHLQGMSPQTSLYWLVFIVCYLALNSWFSCPSQLNLTRSWRKLK